jgi:hypothetical protein
MNAIEFKLIEKMNTNVLEEKTHFEYKGKQYTLYKLTYGKDNEKVSYSIWGVYHTMNIDKVTSKYLRLYTFDMMDQKSTYNMALTEIKFK